MPDNISLALVHRLSSYRRPLLLLRYDHFFAHSRLLCNPGNENDHINTNHIRHVSIQI